MEPRVKLFVAERSIIPTSTDIYRRDQGYKYVTGCNVGEGIDDYWNVDGDRQLSDTWTSFTRFTILDEKPTDGYTWFGREDWQESKRPPDLTVCGQKLGKICQKRRCEEKSKSGPSRNRSLTMLAIAWYLFHWSRRWGIQGDYEKNRVESWKFWCQQQCRAEPDAKSTGTPVAFLGQL